MRSYFNFGLALLLTIVALIIFAYCSFLGLDFYLQGKLLITAAFFVPVLLLLVRSFVLMIRSKAKRNAREGRPRELRNIAVAVIILALGSVPCSKFFEIYQKQDRLSISVKETVAAMTELDRAYLAYANGRLDGVKDAKVRRSLKRRLIPSSYDSVADKRRNWLASLGEASIWNLYTPTNVNMLQNAAESWNKEYNSMSSVIFVCEGKEVEPFTHTASIEKLSAFNSSFADFHTPKLPVVLCTILCIILTLICYIFTERPKTARR